MNYLIKISSILIILSAIFFLSCDFSNEKTIDPVIGDSVKLIGSEVTYQKVHYGNILNHTHVLYIKKGQKVKVLDTDGDMRLVESIKFGVSGWVHKRNLK